ncbi:MAG TPA: exopolysaccharide transport family protein [Rhizomicrobium sp.]|nr:exopolysaccharide transport family protein [Rhizomicrobium sp.]
MGDVVRVAHERFGLIRGVTLVVVLATLAVLLYLPTLYATTASVMLDPRKNNIAEQSAVLAQLPTDPASLQNQIQILQSRDLAAEVIAKLKLYDDPEFNSALKPSPLAKLDPRNWLSQGAPDAATVRERIVSAFAKNLSVSAEGLSTTLNVTFTSRDPEKAALIANTLVDTYIEDQIAAKRAVGDETTAWLIRRTRELADQLQAQDAAVQKYKADNNITEAADGTSLADQQTAAISNQLVLAKADLAQKQATGDRVAQLMKAGDTADVSQILASPLIVQLRTQQASLIAQESELATKYGPRHPKMEAIESQKRDLDSKIATEVNRLAGSIGNDVAVARANVGSLQGSLASAEKQASSQNLVRVKLRALQSNATSTRTMYEAFVTRLREIQDQDAVQSADARVISRAAIPTVPSSPKRMLILGASIPAGLLLGLLIALILERFGEPEVAVVRPAPVVRPMRQPAMATLLGIADPRAADAVLDYPHSDFARTTAQLLQAALRKGKVVAVTSPDGSGAKTVTAVALARMASRMGLKVAVIDASLARPATARAFGIGPVRFGLVETLLGRAPLSRAVCRDPRSGAQVLSVAQPLRDASQVLASARMANLVAHLARACDVVILDAPVPAGAQGERAVERLASTTLAVSADGRVAAR